MAKKYNKGRKQKPNISRRKKKAYQEEIAKELGINEQLNPSQQRKKKDKEEYPSL